MSEFTPGPWEYSGCGIWGKSPFNVRVRLADVIFHNAVNGIASHANGLLIAAAPDAHEANKITVAALASEYSIPPDASDDWIHDTLGSALSTAYFAARAAIAKATTP